MRTASRRRRTTLLRGITALAAATTLAVPLTGAAQAEPGEPADQASAAAVPGTPVVVKQLNAFHLSEKLAGYLEAREDGLSAVAAATSVSVGPSGPGSLLRTPDGRLIVTVGFATYTDTQVAAVQAEGATVLNRNPEGGRITVAVALGDLEAVGGVPGVESVAEELTPETSATCDSTVSEGDVLLRARATRTDLGLTGAGVTVGVLSDSFNQATNRATTMTQDIAQDNLPGAANDCGHTTPVGLGAPSRSGGVDEGRAMAHIVHDLAPGAAIDFESAFNGEDTFAANIVKLADQGADVITDDVYYPSEPMYQEGVISQAVGAVRARGVDYFSSVGNQRTTFNGREVGSYEAVDGYRPVACPALVASYVTDCHDFDAGPGEDPTFDFAGVAGARARVIMQWAEPIGAVESDLELFLIDKTDNTLVASSTGNSTTFQQVYEYFSYYMDGPRSHTYAVVVGGYEDPAAGLVNQDPRFKFVFLNNGAQIFNSLEYTTPTGTDVMGPTAYGHSGGPDTISVGASSVTTRATGLSRYSSYGPVTLLFGPVRGSTPAAPLSAPEVLAKPDLVATDCGVNPFFGQYIGEGFYRFCGTSAAAPHAAAVAALLREQAPGATTAAVAAALTSTSVPYATTPGAYQGAGLLDARAAASALAGTAAPDAPALTGTTPSSPGTSTTPRIQGSAAPGSRVTLYATDDCTGDPVVTGTAAAFASAGLAVTVTANVATTFHATATSPSGVDSACSSGPTGSITYTHDDIAPVAPVLDHFDPDSPGNSRTPLLVGVAEYGSTVRVFQGSTCTGTPVASLDARRFSEEGLVVDVPADAATTFVADSVDPAGNVATCSNAITYVHETRPDAPVLIGTDPASPSAVAAPRVFGSAAGDSTVRLYTTEDCTTEPVATGTAAEFASPGLTALAFANATTTYHATATSPSGAVSSCSSGPGGSVRYTHDDLRPSVPSLSGFDPGTPGSSRTPRLTGAAEEGSTVRVFQGLACSGTPVASLDAARFGTEGVLLDVPADASTSFAVDSVDPAGNASRCTDPVTYVHHTPLTAPVLSGVTPASAQGIWLRITGLAPEGSTVRLYTTSDCTGAATATGTAALLAGAGIKATVAWGSTTTFHATATDATGAVSDCSTSSAEYVQTGPEPPTPDTLITDGPPSVLTPRGPKARVAFTFGSDLPGAVFFCARDAGPLRRCRSGQRYWVLPGTHTFSVAASRRGKLDPTPATYSFTVQRPT